MPFSPLHNPFDFMNAPWYPRLDSDSPPVDSYAFPSSSPKPRSRHNSEFSASPSQGTAASNPGHGTASHQPPPSLLLGSHIFGSSCDPMLPQYPSPPRSYGPGALVAPAGIESVQPLQNILCASECCQSTPRQISRLLSEAPAPNHFAHGSDFRSAADSHTITTNYNYNNSNSNNNKVMDHYTRPTSLSELLLNDIGSSPSTGSGVAKVGIAECDPPFPAYLSGTLYAGMQFDPHATLAAQSLGHGHVGRSISSRGGGHVHHTSSGVNPQDIFNSNYTAIAPGDHGLHDTYVSFRNQDVVGNTGAPSTVPMTMGLSALQARGDQGDGADNDPDGGARLITDTGNVDNRFGNGIHKDTDRFRDVSDVWSLNPQPPEPPMGHAPYQGVLPKDADAAPEDGLPVATITLGRIYRGTGCSHEPGASSTGSTIDVIRRGKGKAMELEAEAVTSVPPQKTRKRAKRSHSKSETDANVPRTVSSPHGGPGQAPAPLSQTLEQLPVFPSGCGTPPVKQPRLTGKRKAAMGTKQPRPLIPNSQSTSPASSTTQQQQPCHSGLTCTKCPQTVPPTAFPTPDKLKAHIKSKHQRFLECRFSFAGCDRSFSTKNEWKRHVLTQHVVPEYWICEYSNCSARGRQFRRRDLFNLHLVRMHMPTELRKEREGLEEAKKAAKEKAGSGTATSTSPASRRKKSAVTKDKSSQSPNNKASTNGGEASSEVASAPTASPELQRLLEEHQRMERASYKKRISLPLRMVCPVPDCLVSPHEDKNAWDTNMEHIASHMQDQALPGIFGNEIDRENLVTWAVKNKILTSNGDGVWKLRVRRV